MFRCAVLMFQREFAQRLVAKPGDKLYCRYVSPSKTILEFSIADTDPGSMTRCFLPLIQDLGWKKKSGSGSEMNIPDHFSESVETFFWVKNT
jgi:hypothetical protein